MNWLKSTGKGSATKQRELDEANAAPYKLETPVIPVPVAESAVVIPAKEEKPAEVKPTAPVKKPRKPRAPRAEAVLIDDVKPKKARATKSK